MESQRGLMSNICSFICACAHHMFMCLHRLAWVCCWKTRGQEVNCKCHPMQLPPCFGPSLSPGAGAHRLSETGWPMNPRTLAVYLFSTGIKCTHRHTLLFTHILGIELRSSCFQGMHELYHLSYLSTGPLFPFQQTMLEQLDRHLQQNEVEATPCHTNVPWSGSQTQELKRQTFWKWALQ